MKYTIALIFLSLTVTNVQDQNTIDWEEGYKLQLSDFQSPATQMGANTLKLETGTEIEFRYNMSEAEFKKIKNFNPKVNCKFNRKAAGLVAPDTASGMNLVRFSQYDFDLSELYTRKLRKKLYEEKSSYSNINFFKEIFEKIQAELNEKRNAAGKETELGRDKRKLKSLRSDVLKEIESLSSFCKTCDPSKKKKKK